MKERKPLPSAIYLFLSDINLYIYIGVFQVHSDFIYENCVCFFPILESIDNTDTWVHACFDKSQEWSNSYFLSTRTISLIDHRPSHA